jgi:hypothetical protein
MPVYVVMHIVIVALCVTGLSRTWKALKHFPYAIGFAKWPLSLLVVLLICSSITIIDLTVADFISNMVLNILAGVQLAYAALVASFLIPKLLRVSRE